MMVWSLSVWDLPVLPVRHMWVLSGFSNFLTKSKTMQMRQTGNSEVFVGVSVSLNGCLSFYLAL